jgi:thiol-disulfide isomerase/thioredoxin
MKKYFLLPLIAVLVMSCSKKVEVKGKITGGSPLERIEFIEASGVATLPLVNLPMDKNGNFSGSFSAPKNGIYAITYAEKNGFLYLKGGQKVVISGNAAIFPMDMKIDGDAKNDNDFIKDNNKFLQTYASKINMGDEMSKDEAAFLKDVQKIQTDLGKHIDESAKKINASSDVVNWKKNDLKVSILGLMAQYDFSHKQAINNPAFKVSKKFKDFENKLKENNDELVRTQPSYRNYLLSSMGQDFQKFAEPYMQNPKNLTSEIFVKFLDTKKDLSQVTKDYLLAFVLAQSDIKPGKFDNQDKIQKIINEKIKDEEVREDLKKINFVLTGIKPGTAAPEISLIKADGKSAKLSELKGKPTLIMFYTSWNPYIAQSSVPVLKEVSAFYKNTLNYAFVNLDDTKEQFIKTSSSMLKGISGNNYYAENGMKSDAAKKFGLYAFKLPCFIVLDKAGKIASKQAFNLGDQELVEVLNKQTGLTPPKVDPRVQLQAGSEVAVPSNTPPPAENQQKEPTQKSQEPKAK